METSPTITKIATALAAFQSAGITVAKDGTNPHFRSTFATLPNVIETIRKPLEAHGLSFAQFPDGDGLTTVLMHISGEWIKATAHLTIEKPTPQAHQSAITYMRRNALLAALGLPTEDDDDGNEASKPSQPRQAAPQRTKPTETHLGLIRLPKNPAVELLAQKDRVVSLLKQLGFKPVGKTVAEKRAEVAEAVFKHANAELTDTNLEAIAEILSAKIEQLEAVADQ
jgi:hypothetical protein